MTGHLSATTDVMQIHIPLGAVLTFLTAHLIPLAVVLFVTVVGLKLRFLFLRSTVITCVLLGVVVGLSLTGRTTL